MDTVIVTDSPPTLGPLVASYGPWKRRWREAWLWPIPGFILAAILVISGLDWYYYGYSQYGPTAAQSWSQDWLFWGISLGILTLILAAWQAYRARVRVNLYRAGVDINLPGSTHRSLRWEEITGVSNITTQDSIRGHILRTKHQVKIFPVQGRPITLDDRFDNLLELTTRLKANLYPRILPGLRARFKAGQALSFGPITIQANVLSIRGRQLQWASINHITVLSGRLVIAINDQDVTHPKKISLPIQQIPNLELFLQVLQPGLI